MTACGVLAGRTQSPEPSATQIDSSVDHTISSRSLCDAMVLRSLSLTLLRQAWLPSCSSSSCGALGNAAEAAATSLQWQAAAAAASSSRPATHLWAQALRGYSTAPSTEPVET